MTHPADDRELPPRAGPAFWVSAAAGWATIGYGLRGLWQHRLDTRPANLAKFAVGGALIHDLILAPLLLAVGVAIARIVPPRLRAIVQAALIVSGSLVLFAYPLVRGYAHALHNPSSLPHNYTANLAVVLAAVWVVAALAIVLRRPARGTGRDKPRRSSTARR
jgi:hypothetical protein